MGYTSDNIQTVVNTIKLTDLSELRVSRIETKEGALAAVDVRQWYCTKSDPVMKPTQKGIRIKADQFDEFMISLNKAMGKNI